ncbi:hypothetical protein ACVL92_001477 [Bradyrhizobium liaoningense]
MREIATGIGPVEVVRPKVRDRGASGPGDRLRFSSAILPLWARRTKSLDALIPVLYLRGISTGDFQEALSALLGKDAPNLSPSVIAGLKADWQVEYERWQRRDLSARRYVYIWADGVYLQARMEDHSECMVNGTRGPRSHGLGADGLRTALEAYRHPELPEGLDGCWNVAPGVLDDGLRSQRAPGRG